MLSDQVQRFYTGRDVLLCLKMPKYGRLLGSPKNADKMTLKHSSMTLCMLLNQN